MTKFVESQPTLIEEVVQGIYKDVRVVESIRRRRRHGSGPISRTFVIAPSRVSNRDLPGDLFTRTSRRSHLEVEADTLVVSDGALIRCNPEFQEIRDDLDRKGLHISDIKLSNLTHIRNGIQADYLTYCITRTN